MWKKGGVDDSADAKMGRSNSGKTGPFNQREASLGILAEDRRQGEGKWKVSVDATGKERVGARKPGKRETEARIVSREPLAKCRE